MTFSAREVHAASWARRDVLLLSKLELSKKASRALDVQEPVLSSDGNSLAMLRCVVGNLAFRAADGASQVVLELSRLCEGFVPSVQSLVGLLGQARGLTRLSSAPRVERACGSASRARAMRRAAGPAATSANARL